MTEKRTTRLLFALLAAGLIAAGCTSDAPAPKTQDPETFATPSDTEGRAAPTYGPPPAVTQAASGWLEAACDLPLDYLRRIRLGVFKDRSPEVLFVPREPNYFGGFTSTTHSGPWPYVQDVPLVFYGPGQVAPLGEIELDRESTLADLAPTQALMVDTPFPDGRPGIAIPEVVDPSRSAPPRLLVTIVWDGGGWNVLNTWPDAWPNLARMMRKGTAIQGVTAGSSPTVTPAIHSTMGTGAFPKQHGIVDIPVRDGDIIAGAFDEITPKYLEVDTLADVYDQATGNEAKVAMFAYKSWHLGMMGHGSYLDGGDKDIAVISEKTQGDLKTNPLYYSMPEYLNSLEGFEEDVRQVDLDDGQLDNKWMGHEVLNDPNALRHTPVWALFQTRILKSIIENEGFGQDEVTDLFFINYKQIDDEGHDWNMLNPEIREIHRYSDDELLKIERYLNKVVGEGQWAITFTADHGQAPDPIASYAWPIRIQLLQKDVAEHFGVPEEELFQDERPVGFWVDPASSVTPEEISDYLVGYRLEENLHPGEDPPSIYEDRMREPLFAAAFPSDRMGEVWNCALEKASE